jgi:biopolymer transport protein ExbB/TolQ
MGPTTFKDILEALQTGGPWTLLILLGWVVRYLYQAREKDRAAYDVEKQKLNDRLLGMAEKQNDVLEKATANQALLLEAVQRSQLRALPHPQESGR